MLPALSELRELRNRLRLTQSELAREAGVSQALIARIEAGTVDPRYSTLRRIFAVLEGRREGAAKAGSIMSSPVVSVSPSDSAEKALRLMKQLNISQLPVLQAGQMVGGVSEALLLERAIAAGGVGNITRKRVSELMGQPFPIVPASEHIDTVLVLLKESSAICVSDAGRIAGIITKADVLRR